MEMRLLCELSTGWRCVFGLVGDMSRRRVLYGFDGCHVDGSSRFIVFSRGVLADQWIGSNRNPLDSTG